MSTLDAVGAAPSVWAHALALQRAAATVGFSWPSNGPVFDKLREEIAEVRVELENGADPARMCDEIGDVLFVLVNLARHTGVDIDTALATANAKFERRFRAMECLAAAEGVDFARCSLADQEALWQRVKQDEGAP